ncbi:MAG: 4Fe-4S binding protein [Candidatus Hydrogenedentes bacterium]|nr:4Fe-4S binding protein [Candidatus Hydrogenedentota bacterium]
MNSRAVKSTLSMLVLVGFVLLFILSALSAYGQTEFRFPRPEFSSDYQHKEMSLPPAALTPPELDIFLLLFLLACTAWAVLYRRSRNWVLFLSILSLGYFGFYRHGCVCSVGSLQNVLDAVIGSGEALPLLIALFFLIPLLASLYFGRIFCAAVCPLGAIQELCAIHPVQVPKAMDQALSMLAYAYLGITVVGIWTGCGYLICRYDPFVGFFRQGENVNILLAGGLLLLAGIFIARPYCRYLCPYGVLLGWTSTFSRRHATVTPAECIQCRLCEEACPYNAIVIPAPAEKIESRKRGTQRIGRLLLVTPIVVLLAAGTGWSVHPFLSRLHHRVALAERIAAEEAGRVEGTTIASDAFRDGGETIDELYAEAWSIRRQFKPLSAGLGAFLGLVLCVRLYRLSRLRHENDYVPDKHACLSCARCFKYCPVEKENAPAKTIPL